MKILTDRRVDLWIELLSACKRYIILYLDVSFVLPSDP